MKSSVRAISLALSLATLAGCAVVPIGPPVYVGARAHYGGYYGHPYYGPYWRRY